MNRGTLVVLALLLASPSIAWGQRAAAERSTPAAKGADEDTTKKRIPRRRSKAKEQETPGVSEAARGLARRTKSIFIYAAESCERAGSRCDPSLRNDSEARFMEACGRCNTVQRCEAERDAVLAGKAKASQDPCAP